MDKSEKARFGLERVNLFVDALRRRNEAMCEMESYSNYNFDMCQQYVSTEVDCMRESDEGSTLRIMDPGRRNELAEDGARHIYHSRKWNCTATIPLWTRECSSSHTRTTSWRRGVWDEKDFTKNATITLPRRRRWTVRRWHLSLRG